MIVRRVVWGISLLLILGLACNQDSQGSVEPTVMDATEIPQVSATSKAISDPPVGSNVGNAIPNFDFTLIDGTTQSTLQLAEEDTPVFLFFFATW